MNSFFRRLSFLCLLSSCGACAKPQPQAPAQVAARAASKKPSRLAERLDLTATQRTEVEEVVRLVRARLARYEVARKALLRAAVRQVREGSLIRSELEPLARTAIDEIRPAIPDVAVLVNRFHSLLTPEQRNRYVDSLEGKNRELSSEQRRQERQERIARVLDLTSGQKTQIYPALLAVMVRHWSAVNGTREGLEDAFDAFRTEEFDARALELTQNVPWEELAEAAFEALELAMSQLSRQQQQTLAAWMEAQGLR